MKCDKYDADIHDVKLYTVTIHIIFISFIIVRSLHLVHAVLNEPEDQPNWMLLRVAELLRSWKRLRQIQIDTSNLTQDISKHVLKQQNM